MRSVIGRLRSVINRISSLYMSEYIAQVKKLLGFYCKKSTYFRYYYSKSQNTFITGYALVNSRSLCSFLTCLRLVFYRNWPRAENEHEAGRDAQQHQFRIFRYILPMFLSCFMCVSVCRCVFV